MAYNSHSACSDLSYQRAAVRRAAPYVGTDDAQRVMRRMPGSARGAGGPQRTSRAVISIPTHPCPEKLHNLPAALFCCTHLL